MDHSLKIWNLNTDKIQQAIQASYGYIASKTNKWVMSETRNPFGFSAFVSKQNINEMQDNITINTVVSIVHYGWVFEHRTLFNIVEAPLNFFFELWCLCCVMMFRWDH